MLEVNFIRANVDLVKERLQVRGLTTKDLTIVDRILEADRTRKQTQTELDGLLAERNRLSKEIGTLFKSGKREEGQALSSRVSEIKIRTEELSNQMQALQNALQEDLLAVPNVPHEKVPPGHSEEDNEVYKPLTGSIPDLPETALPHWELAEKLGIFDLKLGVLITGSGFPLFRGKGAKLERALINFFLDSAAEAGYEEIQPPLLVNSDTARATGQLPDKEGQMYHVERDDLYLIPTAEVPLTNVYRGKILSLNDLPVKMTGYTPCFRREAGSYGADVKGLNRVHQFDKVEIVQMTHPDQSYAALDQMVDYVAGLLDQLELPYRIVRLCGGDLGFTSAMTFDFEVFSAAQQKWLEVSSVSNFETFQSNRMKLRFRNADGKINLAHTLNGSALALPRIMAALIENNQTEQGIRVPKTLQRYTGFELIDGQ